MKRVSVSLSVVAVLAGLFGAPEATAKASRCMAFKPVGVHDYPDDKERAASGEVVGVTRKHTEASPLTFEFSHAPVVGVGWPLPATYVLEPVNEYFNIQVAAAGHDLVLNARLEWAESSVSDIDLGLFNSAGDMVTWSEAWNNPVLDDATSPLFGEPTGGPGFESIAGIAVARCEGFTVVSAPHNNTGEDMVLKVWLSRQG